MNSLVKATLIGTLLFGASSVQANENPITAEISNLISNAISASNKEVKQNTLESVAKTLKLESDKQTKKAVKNDKEENNG